MTSFLWDVISFIVALSILVAVHEFGHFWVARKCGVKVLAFSIGFGKPLWKRIGRDGVEYSISTIPLGGYVKMLDSRNEALSDAEKTQAFDHQSVLKRMAVVAAGPVFNFFFAIFVYWLVFLIGVPTIKPVVGDVVPHSIVAEAGLQSGMEIKAVSGTPTLDWESVNMELASHIGENQLTLTVASPDFIGHNQLLHVNLAAWNFEPEKESPMTALGFKPFSPEAKMTANIIVKKSAAEKAGMMAGDRIVRVNGADVSTWKQVVEKIKNSPNTALDFVIERNHSPLKLTLVPEARKLSSGEVIGFAGIAPEMASWPDGYQFDLQYGPVESIGKAFTKTGQLIALTANMLHKLVVGDIGLNNLSGPISIAKGAGTTAEYGFVYFLGFLGLISVNLGIINLVPLPMLDGGHLLFFIIEAVIKRPVPERIQEIGYKIGGAIIFSFMIMAIFNDFSRL